VYPIKVTRGTIWKEIPFSLLSVIALGLMVNGQFIDSTGQNSLERSDGLLLLLFFIIFIYYTFSIATKMDDVSGKVSVPEYSLLRSFLMIILGLICLTLGGRWIVDGAVHIAKGFGMSEGLIGLTIVAFGTSLPELATSVAAAYKKNVNIAIGNVVGSNIFNILFVLGISSLIKPLAFTRSSNVDIAVVIFASLLLFLSMFTGKKHTLDRWQGALFVVSYVIYVAFLIHAG
jgi:cation:H+ antiporter